MAKNKKQTATTAGRIALIVLASVFLLFCLLQLFLLVWGGDIIKDKMQKEISKGSDNLYHFDAEKVRTSIFGRSVSFQNAVFAADTTRFNELKKNNEADKRLYEINVEKLKLTGIHIMDILFNSSIEINNLNIINPYMKIYNHPDIEKKEDDKAKFSLYELFAPGYSSVKLGLLSVTGGRAELIIPAQDSLIQMHISGFETAIDDIVVDSSHSVGNDKLFYAHLLNLKLDSMGFVIDNNLNQISFSNLIYSSESNILKLDDLTLQPRAGKFEFAQQVGHEKDRVNLNIKSITAYNMSVPEMMQMQMIHIERLVLDKFNMHIFRDKRLPMPEKYKKLPQELIRDFDVPLKVDTLQLNAERITYEELHERSDEAGIVYFTNINGNIYNITNIERDSIENQMDINAHGYLYGKARLDADFKIRLFDENNVFYYSGYLGQIDATEFNQMSVAVAGIKVESATLQKMEFNAHANSHVSTGTMKVWYDNLEIKIEDKSIQSFIANVLVIKNSNPKNDEFREGEMYFERDKRKAITNYCWKTMLSGLKTSIGMGNDAAESDE